MTDRAPSPTSPSFLLLHLVERWWWLELWLWPCRWWVLYLGCSRHRKALKCILALDGHTLSGHPARLVSALLLLLISSSIHQPFEFLCRRSRTWSVFIKVKGVETAIFVDGTAYVHGQQRRTFNYITIQLSEQESEESLPSLINAFCNEHTKSAWGNFIGISYLNVSEDDKPGTVQVNLYALGTNFFYNPQVLYYNTTCKLKGLYTCL